MKLMVQIGYGNWVMFEEFDAAVKAFKSAQVMQSEGYGSDAVYSPVADSKIEMQMVDDAHIKGCASSDTAALIEKVFKLKDENSKLNTRVYTAEAELKKIKEAVTPKEVK